MSIKYVVCQKYVCITTIKSNFMENYFCETEINQMVLSEVRVRSLLEMFFKMSPSVVKSLGVWNDKRLKKC